MLRGEGDGGKRWLLCSLCSTEWQYRRVLCPGCGEENKDKLPIYTAAEFPAARVDACDTCHTYSSPSISPKTATRFLWSMKSPLSR